MTTLIISNGEINDIMKILKCLKESDIMKILKCLKESGLLIKGVSEAIQNEAKEQKGEFLGMLLGTLGDSLLVNLITGKATIRAGEGIIRAGQNVKCCATL